MSGPATSDLPSRPRQRGGPPVALVLASLLCGCLRETREPSHAEPHVADQALCGSAQPAEAWTGPVPALPSGAAVLSAAEGNALLLSDSRSASERIQVPAVCLKEGSPPSSAVRICVSPNGEVSSVHVVQPSIPVIDEQLPEVIARWSYRHHEVAGQPTAFCYGTQYLVR